VSDATVPAFFERFPMRRIRVADLDSALADGAAPLSIVFLWSRDCPNCDMAKRAILNSSTRFEWPQVRWLHGNVYEEPELGTRFGLHGVPAFIVFRGARKMGRITPWPGVDAFVAAIDKLIASLS
jgi:thiol-disulfide isomerase/thioredoxin